MSKAQKFKKKLAEAFPNFLRKLLFIDCLSKSVTKYKHCTEAKTKLTSNIKQIVLQWN